MVSGVLALLEAPQPAAAAKGLVALALLTRASPRFLAQALRVRLLPQVRLACPLVWLCAYPVLLRGWAGCSHARAQTSWRTSAAACASLPKSYLRWRCVQDPLLLARRTGTCSAGIAHSHSFCKGCGWQPPCQQ